MRALVYPIKQFNEMLEKFSDGEIWLVIENGEWFFALANDSERDIHNESNEDFYGFVEECLYKDMEIKAEVTGVYVDITEGMVVVTYITNIRNNNDD